MHNLFITLMLRTKVNIVIVMSKYFFAWVNETDNRIASLDENFKYKMWNDRNNYTGNRVRATANSFIKLG
mgnify:CR=1 FL=1